MKVIVIPDIHENLDFLEEVLSSEHFAACDRAVFLGDYFDRYRGQVGELKPCHVEVATVLRDLQEQYPERIDLLCGNHDITYLALRPLCHGDYEVSCNKVLCQMLDGYAKLGRSKEINAIWDLSVWHKLKGFVAHDGILYSHAGVHRRYWPQSNSIDESLRVLEENWTKALENIDHEPLNVLFTCGEARGASVTSNQGRPGGLLWLDWCLEFEDSLPMPQIVGHSRASKEMKKGRSFCLDCGQTAYGIVTDGQLEVIQI